MRICHIWRSCLAPILDLPSPSALAYPYSSQRNGCRVLPRRSARSVGRLPKRLQAPDETSRSSSKEPTMALSMTLVKEVCQFSSARLTFARMSSERSRATAANAGYR